MIRVGHIRLSVDTRAYVQHLIEPIHSNNPMSIRDMETYIYMLKMSTSLRKFDHDAHVMEHEKR
jgi:hypothetical protein